MEPFYTAEHRLLIGVYCPVAEHRLLTGVYSPVAEHRLLTGLYSPVAEHRLLTGLYCPVAEHRLLTGVYSPVAEHRLQACGPQQLRHTGSVVARAWAQKLSMQLRSCSMVCGTLLDQGSNLCPLHWQVDSHLLHHQGRPSLSF